MLATIPTASTPANAGDEPIEVVILGGGYTAVWACRAISRRLRGDLRAGRVRITIVSASTSHAFHGWTGEVLAGLVRPERTRTPLEELVPQARLVHGRAVGVDLDGCSVVVDTGATRLHVPYDHLLVGVGSVDAANIPGLAEHGRSVKGEWALQATHEHLDDVLRRAAGTRDPVERARLQTIVVAGGGFAGVEMAAAIAERLDVLDRHRAAPVGRVVLVHRGGELLPEVRPRFDRLADYATGRLADLGVEVRLGVGLERVTATGAVVDGTIIEAATVVSTVGQATVPLPGTEAVRRDERGRIVTDAWLRTSRPGVWAGGDAAAVPHVLRGTPCPPNALWAIKHGVRVGDNIVRSIRGRRLRRFRFPGLGQAASLGVGKGAVELYGVTLTGWAGWLARWAFFHWFMPSRRVAVATIRDWLALRRTGRHLTPLPSSSPRSRRPASLFAVPQPSDDGAASASASTAYPEGGDEKPLVHHVHAASA